MVVEAALGLSGFIWNVYPYFSLCVYGIRVSYDCTCVNEVHGSLQWRHNEHNGVSNHRRLYCLLSRLFRHRSKKTSKPRVTGLCAGNSPGTDEFPAQKANNSENVSIWWRHRVKLSDNNKTQQNAKRMHIHQDVGFFCCFVLLQNRKYSRISMPHIKHNYNPHHWIQRLEQISSPVHSYSNLSFSHILGIRTRQAKIRSHPWCPHLNWTNQANFVHIPIIRIWI